MTKLEYDSLLSTILDSLRSVSHSTETVYMRVGSTYKSLVTDLDSLKYESTAKRSGKDVLMGRIGELSSHLEAQTLLLQTRLRDEAHGNSGLEQLKASLDSLGHSTSDLREDSEEMELISLNALVVASKAGQAGKGFAAITAELQNASVLIKELSRSLTLFSQESLQQFQDLQDSQISTSTLDLDNLKFFNCGTTDLMEVLQTRLQELLQGLEAIQNRRSQIKVPLFRIVVEIQNQDAIRQSIDHVILSLGEMDVQGSGSSPEEILDNLCFLEILPELSIQVLGEIEVKIGENHRAFTLLVDQAQNLIFQLNEEQDTLIQKALSSRDGQGLTQIFQDMKSLVSNFVGKSENSLREKKLHQRNTSGLQAKISSLADSLASFENILSRFRNVDVASRIQVARYKELSAMKDNAVEMSRLTQKIQNDVKKTAAAAQGFRLGVSDFLDQDKMTFEIRMTQETSFLDGLTRVISNLEDARDGLAGEVKEQGLFTSSFLKTFSETRAQLETLKTLRSEVATQQEKFRELQSHIKVAKQQYLEEQGLKEWTLHSDKLKAMVERFTIFTHQQIAANLGSFQVEAGAESGEVTLF